MTVQQRKRGPRGDISAGLLLDAADRVLRGGLPGLTLRAVAREAGVTPTVVYTYFADMHDLRTRLGDRFLSGVDLSLLEDETASAPALRRFLDHIVTMFDEAPGHAALLASQRIAGPHALALNEALLAFFVDRVGHPLPLAAASVSFLTEWVHGRVLLAPSNPSTERFERDLAREDLARYPRTLASFATAEDDAVGLVVRALTLPR